MPKFRISQVLQIKYNLLIEIQTCHRWMLRVCKRLMKNNSRLLFFQTMVKNPTNNPSLKLVGLMFLPSAIRLLNSTLGVESIKFRSPFLQPTILSPNHKETMQKPEHLKNQSTHWSQLIHRLENQPIHRLERPPIHRLEKQPISRKMRCKYWNLPMLIKAIMLISKKPRRAILLWILKWKYLKLMCWTWHRKLIHHTIGPNLI